MTFIVIVKVSEILLKLHFNWKLFLIGIISAFGIWKKVPILKVGGPAQASPTSPVIRVVLLHTEAADQDWIHVFYPVRQQVSQQGSQQNKNVFQQNKKQ